MRLAARVAAIDSALQALRAGLGEAATEAQEPARSDTDGASPAVRLPPAFTDGSKALAYLTPQLLSQPAAQLQAQLTAKWGSEMRSANQVRTARPWRSGAGNA